LRCAHKELIARVGRELALNQGDRLDLNVPADRMHLFQDGKRVEP
jgi:hypothetical protein